MQENKYLYDLDVAQQSKYKISFGNIRIVMWYASFICIHAHDKILLIHIGLSYYSVSFKLREFKKLRNSTYFIHKTTTTLIAVSDCLISLFGSAKFDWTTTIQM